MTTAGALGLRWLAGDGAAGSELAATLTAGELRKFGVEALVACADVIGDPPPVVLRVVEVGRVDPRMGHIAFDAVQSLLLTETSFGPLRRELMEVAANAARNIYNSTKPDDPFDADAEDSLFAAVGALCLSLPVARRQELTDKLLLALESTTSLPRSAKELEAVWRGKFVARWMVGDPAACHALAAKMTNDDLRAFAVEVLVTACTAMGETPPAVKELITVGRNAPHLARAAFERLSAQRLETDAKAQPQAAVTRLLLLAESAARVIYNASRPKDPFEAGAGEWLLQATATLLPAMSDLQRQTLTEQLLPALERTTAPSERSDG